MTRAIAAKGARPCAARDIKSGTAISLLWRRTCALAFALAAAITASSLAAAKDRVGDCQAC
jgi:hypothetical protein